jgi:hypothetical protein
MSKKKIDLHANTSLPNIFTALENKFKAFPINKEDGLKIDFENEWVHLRSSNTEPIIRVYTEAPSQASADKLALDIISIIETTRMQFKLEVPNENEYKFYDWVVKGFYRELIIPKKLKHMLIFYSNRFYPNLYFSYLKLFNK